MPLRPRTNLDPRRVSGRVRRPSRSKTSPQLESLESRQVLSTFALGASPGSAPRVEVYDGSGAPTGSFLAFKSTYRGGVNVAVGDVMGDGTADVIVGRKRGDSVVRIFDGESFEPIGRFRAFRRGFRGGVELAFGYFGSDTGRIVVGTATHAAVVRVFDARTFEPISRITPYPAGTNGVRVAVGNLDLNPDAELVVAPGPHAEGIVKGFDPQTGEQYYKFRAAPEGYRRGLDITSGDFTGNGVTDVATALTGPTGSRISVWARSVHGPALAEGFTAFADGGGITLGTYLPHAGPALIAASQLRPGNVTLFNQDGQAVTVIHPARLGNRAPDAASSPDLAEHGASPITPGEWYHIVAYSPTWPQWTTVLPQFTVTSVSDDGKTIGFSYPTDATTPWEADLYVGAHLYNVSTQYYFANSTIGSMTGNPGPATNYLTLSGPDTFSKSNVNQTIQIVNNQLSDSDLTNSAFQDLWSKPRYADSGGQTLSDLQLMASLGSSTGTNAIRLYDWNMKRGYTATAPGPSNGVSEHKAFLDAVQAAGLKVIVPISNTFLGDAYVWNGAAPDANYSTNGLPAGVTDALAYFLKSVSTDGAGGGPGGSSYQLHPAVAGFSIGNEIELNAGVLTPSNNMTVVAQRALWWVVNLQKSLAADNQLGQPTDPNRIRFTIPVSTADLGVIPSLGEKQTSWFQIFRHGALAGDPLPNSAASLAGQSFKQNVTGLEAALGADGYAAWFYNANQTAKVGDDLTNMLSRYNTQSVVGDWTDRWPGEQFPVPLVLTELDFSIIEAGSEAAYFNIFSDQQVHVAESFLRGTAIYNAGKQPVKNVNIMGYTLFEFNQEPNKTIGLTPDAEMTRGFLKYYQGQDVNQWRTHGTAITRGSTGLTTLPPDAGASFAPFQFPVYPLYSITQDPAGQVRLVDKLRSIIKPNMSRSSSARPQLRQRPAAAGGGLVEPGIPRHLLSHLGARLGTGKNVR